MTHSSRSLFLCSQVEEVLTAAHFLRDPYLVSCLRALNRLPISALTGVRTFAKLKASPAEIAQACKGSASVAIIPDRGVPCFVLPFQVHPAVLIIGGAQKGTTVLEIGEFVRMLIGSIRHVAYPTGDGGDFAVNFMDPRDCMAVWRALQIVPLNGDFLTVTGYSPPPPKRGRLQPIIVSAVPIRTKAVIPMQFRMGSVEVKRPDPISS